MPSQETIRLRGIFEKIEPIAHDDGPGVGRARQGQRGRLHLQRPGERLAGVLISTLPAQPARRLRHPKPDQQNQQRRQHADREQQPPFAAADEGAHDRAEADPERNDAGDETTDPPALGGRHELLHQGKVDAIQPAHPEPHKKPHDREIDPAIVGGEIQQPGRDREVQYRADEDLAAADPVGQPSPDIGAHDGAYPRTHQHGGRLAKGQLPGPDQKSEHEADQEVVEELQRVADDGCRQYLDLIAGQPRASIENLEHGVSLWRLFVC